MKMHSHKLIHKGFSFLPLILCASLSAQTLASGVNKATIDGVHVGDNKPDALRALALFYGSTESVKAIYQDTDIANVNTPSSCYSETDPPLNKMIACRVGYSGKDLITGLQVYDEVELVFMNNIVVQAISARRSAEGITLDECVEAQNVSRRRMESQHGPASTGSGRTKDNRSSIIYAWDYTGTPGVYTFKDIKYEGVRVSSVCDKDSETGVYVMNTILIAKSHNEYLNAKRFKLSGGSITENNTGMVNLK